MPTHIRGGARAARLRVADAKVCVHRALLAARGVAVNHDAVGLVSMLVVIAHHADSARSAVARHVPSGELRVTALLYPLRTVRVVIGAAEIRVAGLFRHLRRGLGGRFADTHHAPVIEAGADLAHAIIVTHSHLRSRHLRGDFFGRRLNQFAVFAVAAFHTIVIDATRPRRTRKKRSPYTALRALL